MLIKFEWTEEKSANVVPVFLPFLGCRAKCVYCAQNIQTGKHVTSPEASLAECEHELLKKRERKMPVPELAFYGGTFTMLQEEHWRICLDFARKALNLGLISGFRCSTRPDALAKKRLSEMADVGCTMIELGVQSLNNNALNLSGRGYTGEDCLKACEDVRKAGMKAGIQLMPGMPGVTEDVFMEDTILAIQANACCLRFYPCLVIKGTRLAQMWQDGNFSPWSLEITLKTLAEAWLFAKTRDVPVIRMGLAPEPALDEAVLAGPVHPALGSRIMGRGLLLSIKRILEKKGINIVKAITVPEHCKGYFWGWKRELVPEWQMLGVNKAIFRKGKEVIIEF